MRKRTANPLLSLLIIAAFFVTLLTPLNVFANTDTLRIVSLKPGVWADDLGGIRYDDANGKIIGYDYVFYRIIVSKRGRLKFQGAKDLSIGISTDLPSTTYSGGRSPSVYVWYPPSANVTTQDEIIIDKGTYYISVYGGKFKYSFTPVSTPVNYCRAKALKLKANKKTSILFTRKSNYSRWYKIKLPKNKKINLSFDEVWDFRIYDARGKGIKTIRNGSNRDYCTVKKQPKGTYYIRILSMYDRDKPSWHRDEIDYMTFKWY